MISKIKTLFALLFFTVIYMGVWLLLHSQVIIPAQMAALGN